MAALDTREGRTYVMIVDDHASFADVLGLTINLEEDFAFVGSAGTIAHAISLAARTAPDVILLDARLPDGSGVDAIPRLKEASPHARIVVVTAWADLEMMVHAASLGASGFVPKETPIAEMLHALRTAHDGGLVLERQTLDLVLARVREREDDDSAPGAETLTARESEVLVLMGEGLDPRTIAERLFLSVHTVRSHVKSILAKLGAHSQLEAVVSAVRSGILAAPAQRAFSPDHGGDDPPTRTWP